MNEHTSFDGRIAVVGLALRAPGAATPTEFWSNLIAGTIAGPPPESAGQGSELHPRQIRRLREFDRHLFNMQPAEALLADPQQRAFLELAWEAFEDAGVNPRRFAGRVGVFAGCGRDDYRRRLLDSIPTFEQTHGRQQIEMGNERDYFATNVAYRFDLRGPSYTVQSACSTSLVAIHVAVRSLLTDECDLAVAGGVMIQIPEASAYRYEEGGICSLDGRCRPFTEGSDGTVPASGGGAVILARAADIQSWKLNPYAYVTGTAVNNDGGRKMNFAAPAVGGQVAVISDALDFAGLAPGKIGFLQAHGTGTRLGDEIELTALRQTYGAEASMSAAQPCAVGSIKANIGHTDAGAGVLGFITCALALKQKVIPPTPTQPGDGPDILRLSETSRLFTPRAQAPWTSDEPRRAAVSALGVGGTNAHVVLEESDEVPASAEGTDVPALLALSAATPLALRSVAERLVPHLEEGTLPVSSLASTLWHGRAHLAFRWAAMVGSRAEAITRLRDFISDTDVSLPSGPIRAPNLAVLLPGQGVAIDTSYGELLRTSSVFSEEFGRLGEVIVGAGGPDVLEYRRMPASDPRLSDTEFVQPLLFALQLSLLRSFRIDEAKPALIVGHSLGELVAAIYGGLLDDDDAAAAVVMRAKLMAAAADGAMVTVRASDAEVQQLIAEFDLEIAAKLSSSLSVVAGSPDAAARLIEAAAVRELSVIPLPVTKAFHSRSMDSAAEEFGRFLSSVELRAPSIMVASNLDGTPLTPAMATDPHYWGGQIRRCVDLRSAIDTLVSSAPTGIVDLGPGDGLTNLVRERVFAPAEPPAFFTVAPTRLRKSGRRGIDALSAAWCAGFDLELPIEKRRVERLPTYPFEDTPYWPQSDAITERLSSSRNADISSNTVENKGAAHASSLSEPTPVMNTVHRIWSEAFGRDDVGEADDFFEVGGTSIHATQILRRVNAECGVKIRLHDLYDYPVLGEFSRYIEDRLAVPEQR